MKFTIENLLEVSTEKDVLYLTPKGFWSPKIFAEHGSSMKKFVVEAIDSFKGSPFILYADLRNFKQPINEMKELIGFLMHYGTQNGRYKSIEIVDKNLLQKSIENTAKQGNMNNADRIVVTNTKDADKAVARTRVEMKS